MAIADAVAPEEISHAKKMSRLRKEKEWKDQGEFETEVMKPYLDVCNKTATEWLDLIGDRAEVLMSTNATLQKKLTTQEEELQRLLKTHVLRQGDMDQVRSKLHDGKDRQAIAEKQLRELRDARHAEERALRQQTVELHHKAMELTEKQRGLETQKREDQARAAKNSELLEDLQFMQAKLQLKKAEYDQEDIQHANDKFGGMTNTESEFGEIFKDDIDSMAERHDTKRVSTTSLASPHENRFEAARSLGSPDQSKPGAAAAHEAGGMPQKSPAARSAQPAHSRSSPPPGAKAAPDGACSCGSVLAPGATVCRKCGKRRETIACPCGNALQPESMFCNKCGRKKEDEDATTAPGAKQPVAPSKPSGAAKRPVILGQGAKDAMHIT